MSALQDNLLFYVLPIMSAQATYIYFLGCHANLRVRQLSMALLGIYWCAAAMKVELTLEEMYPHFNYHNPPSDMSKYTPFCDFASWAKCSKVLMSPYGRVMRYAGLATKDSPLDVPNPILGSVYFVCHIVYPALKYIRFPFLNPLATATSVFVGFFSLWLGHKLFFVLHDFCIVCVSSYVANFMLLHTMVRIWAADREQETKNKSS